jgi:histidinol-phosphatase
VSRIESPGVRRLLREELDFALHLAFLAEAEILPRYQRCSVSTKPGGSPVTEADWEAERVIREAIAERYPHDAVLGEEFGESGSARSGRRWIIDPIDGTIWFTLGMPLFGTLIGLVEGADPILGVVHLPATQETLYAARDMGCWLRRPGLVDRQVRTFGTTPLEAATVSVSNLADTDMDPRDRGMSRGLAGVLAAAASFRFCGDCTQHALVARGLIHGAIGTQVHPWDVAALVPCIEEAGGVVSSLDGTRDRIIYEDSILSTCDPILHRRILTMLAV